MTMASPIPDLAAEEARLARAVWQARDAYCDAKTHHQTEQRRNELHQAEQALRAFREEHSL